ncbi:hypothetical protein QFC21_005086 [Naganishia friedmannii]|uniref:Uncharacterized protein n=1 Tax=Naganishia friedmannii TaxID=89922 RepID=A0ACC2VCJ9_9TREE|nr:hypothetical protein QFC21_005086 [Naganishia friedmannii]
MVHKISIEKMSQDRHAASTSNSKVFGLLNGHGFGLFPTGRGNMAYGSASRYDLEEDDDVLSYRFGARRAGKSRGLTGGRNIRSLLTRNPSRSSVLIAILIGIAFLLGRYTGLSLHSHPSIYPAPPFLIPPSKFDPITPEQLLALSPISTNRSLYPAPMPPTKRGHVVPNVLHYVYGLKDTARTDGKGDEFPYYAYLAIRSALVNIKPEKAYFHYHNIPTGVWWDELLPELTLIRHETVLSHIMGKELKHFAHKSDVHGETDFETWLIFVACGSRTRPFEPLMYHPTTLGMEASPDSRRTELEPEGLCNGVIIAQNGSEFLKRWRTTYETFDEGNWAGHSVVMPWQLARKYPSEVQVLSTRAFFWPLWSGDEIEKVHELDEYDFTASGQFGYHAWESLAMRYLSNLSPEKIRTVDSSFNKMVRPVEVAVVKATNDPAGILRLRSVNHSDSRSGRVSEVHVVECEVALDRGGLYHPAFGRFRVDFRPHIDLLEDSGGRGLGFRGVGNKREHIFAIGKDSIALKQYLVAKMKAKSTPGLNRSENNRVQDRKESVGGVFAVSNPCRIDVEHQCNDEERQGLSVGEEQV